MRHLFEGDGSLVVANLYNYLDSHAVRTVILFFLQKKSEILCQTDVKNRILYLNLQKRVRGSYIIIGNAGVQISRNSEYVDKSGLIA